MKTRIEKFTSDLKEWYLLSVSIRRKVFIDEQNVDPNLEMEHEDESFYFLVFADNVAVATARYRMVDDKIKLERFAILPEYRGKGLGNVLIKAVLEETIPLKKLIYLNSQHQVVEYYAKWGFEPVGDSFVEADILHYRMELNREKYFDIMKTEYYLKSICRR